MSEAASPFPSFELRVEGIGAFPNPARPRVIWAGLKPSEPGPLVQIQETIARNVAENRLPLRQRPFHTPRDLGTNQARPPQAPGPRPDEDPLELPNLGGRGIHRAEN